MPIASRSALAVLAILLPAALAAGPIQYPETRKVDQKDTFHGVTVADPYRWLEEDVRKSEEVAEWVEAQNKVTFAYLKAIPEREAIAEAPHRAVELSRYSLPFKEGGRYFSTRNDGLQNQAVLYVQRLARRRAARCCSTPTPGPRTAPSPWPTSPPARTARYLAYGVAEAGSRLADVAASWTSPRGKTWPTS